jgi:cell division septation protein DedD
VVEPAVSKKTLDAWNREHSMRVRRVRAESGITPKPNTPAYDVRDLMSSTKWAAPRALPPPPAAAVCSQLDASSAAAAAEAAAAAARIVSSSRGGALTDLAGLASDDAPAAMAEADCCRHWVSQSHKFEGEVSAGPPISHPFEPSLIRRPAPPSDPQSPLRNVHLPFTPFFRTAAPLGHLPHQDDLPIT